MESQAKRGRPYSAYRDPLFDLIKKQFKHEFSTENGYFNLPKRDHSVYKQLSEKLVKFGQSAVSIYKCIERSKKEVSDRIGCVYHQDLR